MLILIEVLKAAKAECPTLRGDIHFFVGGVAEIKPAVFTRFHAGAAYSELNTFATNS